MNDPRRIARLAGAVQSALANPALQARMAELGVDGGGWRPLVHRGHAIILGARSERRIRTTD